MARSFHWSVRHNSLRCSLVISSSCSTTLLLGNISKNQLSWVVHCRSTIQYTCTYTLFEMQKHAMVCDRPNFCYKRIEAYTLSAKRMHHVLIYIAFYSHYLPVWKVLEYGKSSLQLWGCISVSYLWYSYSQFAFIFRGCTVSLFPYWGMLKRKRNGTV